MQLFSRLLSSNPASPRLTTYDESTGSRLDFSAQTLDNWAAKVANMLRDELDLDPGSTISIDLPASWQSAAIIFGALAANVNISFNPSEGDVFFTAIGNAENLKDYAASLGASGDIVVINDDPMGRGVEESGKHLGPGLLDFSPTVRFYGDHFPEEGPTLEELAPESTLEEGTRTISTGWTDYQGFAQQVLAPLAASGSAVIVSGPVDTNRLERIASSEKAVLS